jgi:ribosomal protein S17E
MQGRVRTKTVKRASRVLIEKYYQKLTLDFDTNKRICDEVAVIQSKRLRNKIAGFTTVRGINILTSMEILKLMYVLVPKAPSGTDDVPA